MDETMNLGDYFANGFKDEFPDQAQETLAGRAQHYIKIFGRDMNKVVKMLQEDCMAADGQMYANTAEIRMAIAEALANSRRLINPEWSDKVLVNSEIIEVDPDRHLDMLVTDVQTWKNLNGHGFGIYELDIAFGGLHPRETMALVGAPGSMKTSLALNAVDNYLRNNTGMVVFFSLDMPAGDISKRRLMREMDCFASELNQLIKTGDPSISKARARMAEFEKGRFRLVGKKSGGVKRTWEEIRNTVMQIAPELVIIDYLTCIGDYFSELEAVRDLMPKICGMAEDFNISIILLSQMGRASRAAQKTSSGGHAAGGHYVEDAVDVEIELLKQIDTDNNVDFVATVTKTRKAVSGRSFRLKYIPRTMEFLSTAQEVRRAQKPQKIFEI